MSLQTSELGRGKSISSSGYVNPWEKSPHANHKGKLNKYKKKEFKHTPDYETSATQF
jgi:hypothetical protein